ncbi:MAG: phytanoyl-CoA dioxygenase [Flavobacterium sp. MedPE-SWcel]|uniref:phytanoyl-CoA dioxygenase family protein n=1 Tax=uncultured Flavobacterium sp. TaxID=165435 RepID=UPI0009127F9D|nr:phytanoyl-CoA dioxygenase family protein [uncultured Flavobacterium sp.]OIQ16951.1 MAG: phytanoyl-CoA dioxygenase [Flavobacterium sp. MedPE-SWcel]
MSFSKYKNEIEENGFAVIPEVFTKAEINTIASYIDEADTNNDTFRKSAGLFAIRQFLREVPKTQQKIFNSRFQNIVETLFGEGYFSIKSIYFDKPEKSNWFVALHQDLSISVDKKVELDGFSSWTIKQKQFAVQPPLPILENIYTIRIHLDDTDENNGALKVIPKSHSKGIYRPETIDWETEKVTTCNVNAGGVMIMKPLLLHSSERTTNNKKRRVIHIELANKQLPPEIEWAEKLSLKN